MEHGSEVNYAEMLNNLREAFIKNAMENIRDESENNKKEVAEHPDFYNSDEYHESYGNSDPLVFTGCDKLTDEELYYIVQMVPDDWFEFMSNFSRQEEQLAEMAVSEVAGTAKKIVKDAESKNTDMDKEIEKQMRQMEHMAKQTVKVAQVVTAGWGKDGAERRPAMKSQAFFSK